MNSSDLKRFWSKVEKSNTCWKWTAQKSKFGYGRFKLNRKMCLSHRVSWELHNSDIPKRLLVLHKCDEPSCIRPSHLFLGTQNDNMKDMAEKKRSTFGEKHPKVKLTEKQVKDIRSAAHYWGVQTDLAKKYNVGTTTINNIINNKNWKHI